MPKKHMTDDPNWYTKYNHITGYRSKYALFADYKEKEKQQNKKS